MQRSVRYQMRYSCTLRGTYIARLPNFLIKVHAQTDEERWDIFMAGCGSTRFWVDAGLEVVVACQELRILESWQNLIRLQLYLIPSNPWCNGSLQIHHFQVVTNNLSQIQFDIAVHFWQIQVGCIKINLLE